MGKITMPKLGLTMTEGTVSSLKVKKGDGVKQGDLLLVVATEKLTYDVEAPEEGLVLDLLVAEGDTVPVGAVLMFLGNEGEQVLDSELPLNIPENTLTRIDQGKSLKTTKESFSVGDSSVASRNSASPLAKKWARAFRLDQAAINGSGPGGMITKADVMKEAGKFRATPLARKQARDSGLAITDIPGSGPDGRTLSADVKAWIEGNSEQRVKVSPVASKLAADHGIDLRGVSASGRIMKKDILEIARAGASKASSSGLAGSLAQDSPGEERRVPLTPMRKIIAQRMFMSTSTIPSVFFNIEVDFGEFIRFRETLNGYLAEKGIKISFNDILMKICAVALMDVPLANAWYDPEAQEYIMHTDANIGLAVAVEGGLLVPNVKGVQRKNLVQVAAESAELVAKARKGKILPEEMQGGTFTITNLGMFGIHDFIPIINPPEACILAVNSVIEKPVARNGNIEIRPVSMIGLSADHRILNGAEAADFLAKVKKLAENPWVILIQDSM
ncbi:MAG TPA: 2-oxo acid dehydrogenase subunit E2 [Synergistetes bacterium]|nr:2-oxo acid dehydrogenase subunit E2 [Synergistota bacterium]